MSTRLPLVVHVEPDAPPKPAEGAACNGCGLCCLAEPCPAGMLLSRRRHGACTVLRWSPQERRYHCGLLTDPAVTLPWLPRGAHPVLVRLARRWISAGSGCDCAYIQLPGR